VTTSPVSNLTPQPVLPKFFIFHPQSFRCFFNSFEPVVKVRRFARSNLFWHPQTTWVAGCDWPGWFASTFRFVLKVVLKQY